ncbi:MAG: Tad domain-containing protein [Bryobacteraceae bacterium]
MVLILFALSALVIFGFMALAFDLGRLYIAKTEAQSFCDAAALAAVLMLDGTTFAKAIDAVHGNYQGTETPTTGEWKRYHFQNVTFTDIEVRFSQDGVNYELKSPGDDASGYRFAEVRASAQIPVYFAQVLTGSSTSSTTAVARAAQVLKIYWDEGLVPFWITAHCTKVANNPFNMPVCASENDDTDKGNEDQYDEDVRLQVGVQYAVLWQSADIKKGYNKDQTTITPDVTYQNANWCAGDTYGGDPPFNEAFGQMALGDRTDYIGVSRLQNSREGWGFWNVFRNPGTNLYERLIWGSIGETVKITDATMENFETEGGQRTSLRAALEQRASRSPYACAPVIDPLTLRWLTVRAIEFIPGAYGANNTWCAIYRDSALNDCSLRPAAETAGVYEVRLVR